MMDYRAYAMHALPVRFSYPASRLNAKFECFKRQELTFGGEVFLLIYGRVVWYADRSESVLGAFDNSRNSIAFSYGCIEF